MGKAYDVVVLGAGASGSVIAARLSEDPACRVLLLEAGPDFPDEAERPPLFAVSGEQCWRVSGVPEFDWNFVDENAAGTLGHRKLRLPRGRLVGGSSMVNSTIAVRGAPFDYDRWAALGNPGWAWADLLPWFCAIEDDRDYGHDPVHGVGGPIVVQRYRPDAWTPVNHAFHEACGELGVREADDLNAPEGHAGVHGRLPHNRWKELRLGALVTYLRTARGRPNLEIRAETLCDRVVLERGRATGVRLVAADGAAGTVHADRVVIAAGVYNSPAILLRSGIGPAADLRALGLDVQAELPVGLHLTDHPGCAFLFRASALAGTIGRHFATNWRGPATRGQEPDWQTHPMPIDEEDGIAGFWSYITRQEARGTVRLASLDPREAPRIDHRYLTSDADVARFASAWEGCRELLATSPFASTGATWLDPEKTLRERLRDGLASAHHQSGTCRMGPDPADSVVDATLAVHGVDGLTVADGSVFPDTIMHNTHLTCVVIGEVAADRLRGRERPAQASSGSGATMTVTPSASIA